jgi:hypothetical protein
MATGNPIVFSIRRLLKNVVVMYIIDWQFVSSHPTPSTLDSV